MPFNPNLPITTTALSATEIRNQLTSLKALIDAVPAGPPGPAGADGQVGPAGPAGRDGEVGPAGPAGRDGLDGAAGSPGADGVSVVSVQDSGDGRVMIGLSNGQTYGPFTAAAGPPGPVGPPGNDGSNGSNGSNGMDGVGIANIYDAGGGQLMVQLSTGSSYGPIPLPAGPQGPPGNDGTSGMNGADGVSVTNVYDAGGGQIVIQLSNGQQFGPFPLATGPQGLPGNDGAPGRDGMDGQNGADGVSITNIYDAGGGQLMIQLSNGSSYGPFTLPTGPQGAPGRDALPLTARGVWQPGQYYVGDRVSWQGIDYVAGLTFLSGSPPDSDLNWLRFTGPAGRDGAPGEVSAQQLSDAIATTSGNSNSVANLSMAVPNPATIEDLQNCISVMAAKFDELISALRR